jgi:probable rRNA maturation factor
MKVSVFNNQSVLNIDSKKVKKVAFNVTALEQKSYDEVAIHFATVEEISRLHDEFFEDPSPTDCISFPMDAWDAPGYRVMGEVFVCPAVALEYAKRRQKDPYHETTLYVVHGLLHLMGYDDTDPKARARMRAAERKHLKNLADLNLILSIPSNL